MRMKLDITCSSDMCTGFDPQGDQSEFLQVFFNFS